MSHKTASVTKWRLNSGHLYLGLSQLKIG